MQVSGQRRHGIQSERGGVMWGNVMDRGKLKFQISVATSRET
jgi:hypothetical protein